MENASKALIIAGAILLSIAIIGIGVAVLNAANSADPSQAMSEAEVQTFNSKFDGYEGTKNGSMVRSMLDTIRTHNAQIDDQSKQIVVKNGSELNGSTVDGGTAGTLANDINTIKKAIVAGNRYKITFNYTATGQIKEIGIK